MATVAYKVEITNPELIRNYQSLYEATGKLGGAKNSRLEKRFGDAIEETLSKFYGGKVSELAKKNVAGVPDLVIESSRVASALSRAFGTDIEDVMTPEVKAKRSEKLGTTIGQKAYSEFSPGLLSTLKLQASQAEQEGLVRDSFDINNPAEVMRAVRAKLGSAAGFFNLIRDNDPDLHMQFYTKAKNLQISKAVVLKGKVSSVNVINIFFPKSDFTSPPFTTELYGKDSISYVLSSTFERKLIKELQSTGPAIVAASIEDFQNQLDKLPGNRRITKGAQFKGGTFDFDIIYGVPTGGSIPRVNARVKKGNTKRRKQVKGTAQFISSQQLTVILRNRIKDRMPVGGPPDPAEGLKYRTGKFVNSLQFIANYRKNLISYYAEAPVSEYFDKFHRRPYAIGQRLINPTIRQTVQELFGRQFRITRT